MPSAGRSFPLSPSHQAPALLLILLFFLSEPRPSQARPPHMGGLFYLAVKTPDSCLVMDRPSEGLKPKACSQRNRRLLSAEFHFVPLLLRFLLRREEAFEFLVIRSGPLERGPDRHFGSPLSPRPIAFFPVQLFSGCGLFSFLGAGQLAGEEGPAMVQVGPRTFSPYSPWPGLDKAVFLSFFGQPSAGGLRRGPKYENRRF